MPKIIRNLADYRQNSIKKVNSTHDVIIINKHDSQKDFFYKKDNSIDATKEAIASAFYRLLIGNRAAEVSLALDRKQECIGTISKGIIGFTEAIQKNISTFVFPSPSGINIFFSINFRIWRDISELAFPAKRSFRSDA